MMQPLNPELFPPVPTDTAQAARLVLQRSNFYLTVGDQVNSLFCGLVLDDAPGWIQNSAQTLSLLYLITIFQFIEVLPDHLATPALRMRVDWKYALHLPLNYPGLDASLFCEFRQWLLKNKIGAKNMQFLLTRLSRISEQTSKQQLCPEIDMVIIDVCLFSRLAKVWETIKQALEVIAINQPDLLFGISLPYWDIRYSYHCRNLTLRTERRELARLAQVIGADGLYIIQAISEAGASELVNLPEVQALQRVWHEQYEWIEGKLSWREDACIYCALRIQEVVMEGKRSLW
jgi:transposase